MLPDIQPGNTKILYFFNCLLDGMHTISLSVGVCFATQIRIYSSAANSLNFCFAFGDRFFGTCTSIIVY